MTIKELMDICNDNNNCSICPAKKACQEFNRILKGVSEPWELYRFEEYEFFPAQEITEQEEVSNEARQYWNAVNAEVDRRRNDGTD